MKQYVIMEVEPIPDGAIGFKHIGRDMNDGTWIDSCHVIDGETLRRRLESIITSDHEGWSLGEYVKEAVSLILNPPKKPESEWDIWDKNCPMTDWTPKMKKALAAWIKAMPRKP